MQRVGKDRAGPVRGTLDQTYRVGRSENYQHAPQALPLVRVGVRIYRNAKCAQGMRAQTSLARSNLQPQHFRSD